MSEKKRTTTHVVERHTPTGKVRLRVVETPPVFEPKPGLPPGGRSECRNGPRPCPYVRCSHHLWFVDGRDRQGRRGRGAFGRDSDERRIESTVEARWLETPTPPSCERDILEDIARKKLENPRYRITVAAIAAAFGRSPAAVRSLTARARRKLRRLQRVREIAEAANEQRAVEDAHDPRVMAPGCRRVGPAGGSE